MKSSILFAVALCASIAFTTGCGQPNTDGDKKAEPGTHVHADGTVHSDDHGHAHGDGHTHGPGPHGGTIADWGGGKFHVEFTVDHNKQEATVYILGTDEKTPASIDAKEITLTIKDPSFTTTLQAKPLESELLGGSSRFVGNHESLGVVQEYEGSMSGVVDGTPYSGNFKEEAENH